ncbi:MAG: squalene/phytoene synthase family protein [Verrucomicrobiota bacterium]
MVSLTESYAYCTALAKSHYENFPVGLVVPAEMQPHVHAVYAFARIADDFADEGYTNEPSKPVTTPTEPKTEIERLAALNDWEDYLTELENNDQLIFRFRFSPTFSPLSSKMSSNVATKILTKC